MSDNVNVAAAVYDFGHEVTKGDQAKEEMVMMMQPFNNMSAQLSAAPLCISILGQLCLIATGKDFSLIDKNDKDKKFNILVHPSSFRASLCQVSNEGYLAFAEADKAMDIIRLSTYQVPGLMTQSLKILFKATPREVVAHLPISLGRIREIAEECTTVAESVVAKYNRVIDTLHELQIASLAAQGRTQEAKELADFEAEQKKIEKQSLDQIKLKIDEDYTVLQNRMEEAQKEYKDALDNMPGAWSLIGLSLTESICSTVLPALSMATVAGVAGAAMSNLEFLASTAALAMGAKKMMDSNGNNSNSVDDGEDLDLDGVACLSTADVILFQRASQLEAYLDLMENFFEETIDGKKLNDNIIQGIEKPTGCISAQDATVMIGTVERSIHAEKNSGGDEKLIKNLSKICRDSKCLVAHFKDASEKSNATAKQLVGLEKRLVKLKADICNINITLSSRSKVPAVHKKGPGIWQKAKNMVGIGGGKKSLVDSHLQTAHVKLEVTKEQLKSVEEQADKAMERQLEVNHRLQENLRNLATFDAERAKQHEILEVLQEGLRAFGQLKEQWTKLLAFFQAMANLINTSLGPPLKMFADHTEKISQERQQGLEPSDICKELIYQPAYEAVKVAYLVHNLAGSYCEISSEHLMPLVSRLGIMISYDSVKEKNEIIDEKKNVETQALEMQKTIEDIVKAGNKKFHQQVEHRINAIEHEFQKKVPAIPEEKKKEIETFVHEAFEKGNRGAEFDDVDFEEFS